ncbi:hypothetical protein EDD85DRAFT_951777 [Armillaria nabsnona]|nr:hypothetical protein EDD85DRAFT_951777 [Armillaria nabsnona]
MFIEDLADSLPAYYRHGLLRLPKAVPKPVHHLLHMDSQKRVELVEVLILWHLVDELMRCEGIDDGEFKVDYSVNFKPTQTLTKWVAQLADWPALLQNAYRSRESTQEKADLPALTTTDLSAEQRELWKDLQAAWSWNRKGHVSYWHKLLQLIEGVAWQLHWMRRTRGDPQAYGEKLQAFALEHGYSEWAHDAAPPSVQCLMYACGADDRDKPVKLRDIECGMWSMLLGVAAGPLPPRTLLFLFFTYVTQIFTKAHLFSRVLHGSQTSSIEVASDTGVEKRPIETRSIDGEPSNLMPEEVVLENVPSQLTPNVDLGELLSSEGPGPISSVATAKAFRPGASATHSIVEERLRPKCEVQVQARISDYAEDEKDIKVAPKKKVKQKKKSKPKSKAVISSADDESDVQQAPVSGSHAVPLIQQRPPQVRLSKQELAEYSQKGANDEDSIWRSTFMEVHRTKGPVMGAVQRPMRTRQCVSPEIASSPIHKRQRSPVGSTKWGWNSWTARELGDLNTPIIVHKSVCRVTEGSAHSMKPTVEITSTLQTMLNKGSKGATGRVLNALTLPMPDTSLQTPLFHQVASHLEACKITCAIGSDLLSAPFLAVALSWGLAMVTGAVTPPHTDFGGSAVKIHTLAGRKIWFVINKRNSTESTDSWDNFLHDFHGDSKVNTNVYQCEVVLVEPGTIWFQRPNTLHAVVTETNSLIFGQHFFPTSAIRSVVMGWIHTAFLSFAITNVEHRDMRVLLLQMMAYWKKVIMEEEDLAVHEGHVPDIGTREGFLDLCALGNLVIYLPAFSGPKDRHWINLHFAVAQYWELVSWVNQRLTLTGLHNTGEVYEAHVAFKLSALQFGQALINYHEAIKRSHLYEAIDMEDRLHRTWFRTDVVKLCEDIIDDELKWEQRREDQLQEDSLFWGPPFDISRVEDIPDNVDILQYEDIHPVDDAGQGDESESSPLSSLSATPEPQEASSAVPLMQLASPTHKRNPKHQDVSDSQSHMSLESSDSSLSPLHKKATSPKAKTSLALEMDTDQSGSPRKPVLKKRRLSARAFLSANSDSDSGDTECKMLHCLKSEGSTDSEASSNEGDSAFLDGLEGQSQATYEDGALIDNDQAVSQDSNPVDWPASLVLRFKSLMEEELDSLSDAKRFDVIMACHEEVMRSQEMTEQTQVSANVEFPTDQDEEVHTHTMEDMPMSAVEFDDGELGEEYLRFMSEEAFSHGLTDENGAHASVDVPLTNKRQLVLAEEGETMVKRQQVLSPTPAGNIGALISATSQSFVRLSGVGLPPDLVQQIIMIDSGLRDRKSTDSGMVEENKIWDISDEDEEDEPESPADVEETLCAQARNATASKTLITPHPTLHTQTLKFLGGYYVIEAD